MIQIAATITLWPRLSSTAAKVCLVESEAESSADVNINILTPAGTCEEVASD